MGRIRIFCVCVCGGGGGGGGQFYIHVHLYDNLANQNYILSHMIILHTYEDSGGWVWHCLGIHHLQKQCVQ